MRRASIEDRVRKLEQNQKKHDKHQYSIDKVSGKGLKLRRIAIILGFKFWLPMWSHLVLSEYDSLSRSCGELREEANCIMVEIVELLGLFGRAMIWVDTALLVLSMEIRDGVSSLAEGKPLN